MGYPRFLALGLLALAALLVPAGPKGVSGLTAGYPDSMASLGDSITRATNPESEPFLLGDQPQYSWSTGDSSAVESHYYRILQQNSLISGNNYNDAVSGARMTDLNGQALSAVSQGVEYVTILMGANDVCTSSEATMTTVETYRSQFLKAMDTLTSGLPDARIFVATIPDIYGLWSILKDNWSARFMWNTFSICQSLLANPTSTALADVERRDRVRQRNIDFNTQLAKVCALYTNCLLDNNTGFNTQYEPIHISSLDYFHPSIAGQTLAASVTWDATYFGDPDGDGYSNAVDNCPDTPNTGQENNVHPGTPEGDHCEDAEADGVFDIDDNCPDTANPGQEDNVHPGNGIGDHCEDPDTDDVVDFTEDKCGSDPDAGASIPERLDGAFNGVDDDGNDGADEALPPGSAGYDCDGDGWTGTQEEMIFNTVGTANDQDPCGGDGWPGDVPDPANPGGDNKLNIIDLNSFTNPQGPGPPPRYNVFGEDVSGNALSPATASVGRWYLQPGGGNTINIADLNALVNGPTAYPAMFGFERAFANPLFGATGQCPWPP